MSDYFESEVEPLFGSDENFIYRKKKPHSKFNGLYSYEIRILNEKNNKYEYTTISNGKNQKDAIKNFRNNESDIREKYLLLGGYFRN